MSTALWLSLAYYCCHERCEQSFGRCRHRYRLAMVPFSSPPLSCSRGFLAMHLRLQSRDMTGMVNACFFWHPIPDLENPEHSSIRCFDVQVRSSSLPFNRNVAFNRDNVSVKCLFSSLHFDDQCMARIGAMGPTTLASQMHIGRIGDTGLDARGVLVCFGKLSGHWSMNISYLTSHLVFQDTEHWHSCRLHLRSYALVAPSLTVPCPTSQCSLLRTQLSLSDSSTQSYSHHGGDQGTRRQGRGTACRRQSTRVRACRVDQGPGSSQALHPLLFRSYGCVCYHRL
jgi:hypothetical protein